MTTSMPAQGGRIDVILARLEGVQRAGIGYRARCPSCGGRSQKLSVTEVDTGRILLHCFGGCTPVAVTTAIGLTLRDLFPERLRPETPEERRAWRRAARETQWSAAVKALEFEATVVLIAARQISSGQPLAIEDEDRLAVAVANITDARETLRAP